MPVTDFVGTPVPACQAIRRRYGEGKVRRPTHVAMPTVWGVVLHEWWGLSKGLTWSLWQAMSVSTFSEVQALRQRCLLWPQVVTGYLALTEHKVTPQEMMKIGELLLRESRISLDEARQFESAILAHTDASGAWRG